MWNFKNMSPFHAHGFNIGEVNLTSHWPTAVRIYFRKHFNDCFSSWKWTMQNNSILLDFKLCMLSRFRIEHFTWCCKKGIFKCMLTYNEKRIYFYFAFLQAKKRENFLKFCLIKSQSWGKKSICIFVHYSEKVKGVEF